MLKLSHGLMFKESPWYNSDMQRKVSFAPGEYFHIYNRGAHKADIFLEDGDYRRFILLLYITNNTETIHLSSINRSGKKDDLFSILRPERLVDIGAYCLMPNHFHLLVHSRNDTGISLFMKKLLTAYSMFFNKKHEHSGALFQGPFQAQHVATDQHLKHLFAYIHLNPLSVKYPDWKEKGIRNTKYAKDFLGSFHYSSYLDFIGSGRDQKVILSAEVFPKYFGSERDFDDFLTDWLTTVSTMKQE